MTQPGIVLQSPGPFCNSYGDGQINLHESSNSFWKSGNLSYVPRIYICLSPSVTDSLPSLNLLCHSETDAWFMQDGPKAVWNIPYISVAFFPSLKQNFIAYRSSKVSDCIFEIHQPWQSGFSRVCSNSCCSCSFEAEIIEIGQSSYTMYSDNILNFQDFTTILNAHTKKVWKHIVCTSCIVINRQTVSLNHNSSV